MSLSITSSLPIQPPTDEVVDPGFNLPDYTWWVEMQMMMMVFGDDAPGAIEPFELGEF